MSRVPLNQDSNPAEEYQRRLDLAREAEKALGRRDEIVANVRLLVFVTVLVLGWSSFYGRWISPFWLVVPAVVFAGCLVVHDRLAKAKSRAKARSAIYELGLARIGDDWIGKGAAGERFLDPDHPYAADLDLFGRGSLFQRISMARTRAGEALLASWLLAPSEIDAILHRQEAVAELKSDLDFREDLAHQGEDAKRKSKLDTLIEWAERPAEMPGGPLRIVALLLGILGVFAVLAWLFTGVGYLPLLVVGIADGIFVGWLYRRVGQVLEGVEKASDDLASLEGMLATIESQAFQSLRLASLRESLLQGQTTASRRVADLRRRADLLSWRQNLFLRPSHPSCSGGPRLPLPLKPGDRGPGKACAAGSRRSRNSRRSRRSRRSRSRTPRTPFPSS